jgi:hypothetical protein
MDNPGFGGWIIGVPDNLQTPYSEQYWSQTGCGKSMFVVKFTASGMIFASLPRN